MIGIILRLGSEVIEIRVSDNDCYFRSSQYGSQFVPIEGLQLSKSGVMKEFPDLIDDEAWKVKAIERFKERLSNMTSEQERIDYIISDMKKFGYKPVAIQKQGHRLQKL